MMPPRRIEKQNLIVEYAIIAVKHVEDVAGQLHLLMTPVFHYCNGIVQEVNAPCHKSKLVLRLLTFISTSLTNNIFHMQKEWDQQIHHKHVHVLFNANMLSRCIIKRKRLLLALHKNILALFDLIPLDIAMLSITILNFLKF